MYVKLAYTYTAMKIIWTPYILWSDVRKSNRIKSNIESQKKYNESSITYKVRSSNHGTFVEKKFQQLNITFFRRFTEYFRAKLK